MKKVTNKIELLELVFSKKREWKELRNAQNNHRAEDTVAIKTIVNSDEAEWGGDFKSFFDNEEFPMSVFIYRETFKDADEDGYYEYEEITIRIEDMEIDFNKCKELKQNKELHSTISNFIEGNLEFDEKFDGDEYSIMVFQGEIFINIKYYKIGSIEV